MGLLARWRADAIPRRQLGQSLHTHPRLRALLLPHRRKPSCFHESHDITSLATVSMLLCQQFLPLLPSLKETPTLAYDGVRGIMPFPERIVINCIHRLLRVELAVTPSFVVSLLWPSSSPATKTMNATTSNAAKIHAHINNLFISSFLL